MINIDNDNSLLTAGVWAEYMNSKFLITHMSNMAFQRLVARKQAPHRSKIDRGILDPQLARDVMIDAMSQALVLDWKDVVDGEGKPVPFSKEACLKALKNNDDLRDFVSEFAMNLENFRKQEKEALGKS